MFAFTDVVNFFAYKLAGLCARRFTFALILLCAFQSFFLGHRILLVECDALW